jgi:alanyl-tRNA synthetase
LKIRIEEVLKEKGKIFAISSESPFYVDYKGGQLGDRGKIGNASVLSVMSKNGKIYHEIDREVDLGENDVEIDLNHQLFVRQHHTAQHILSAVFEELADISTVGFRMGFEYTTIDLNVPYVVEELLNEVEERVNSIITECVDVQEILVEKEEIDRFPLRKKLSDKVEGMVRIIKIGEYDYSPCGGYHVENTGQIGLLKILKTEKVKGELTRVYFVAGFKAMEYFRKYSKILKNISVSLTSSIFEVEDKVKSLLREVKEKSSRLENLAEKLSFYKKDDLKKLREDVYFLQEEPEILRYIPKYFDKEGLLVLYDGKSYSFTSNSSKYIVRDIIYDLRERFGGKGGGGKEKGSYLPSDGVNIYMILEALK